MCYPPLLICLLSRFCLNWMTIGSSQLSFRKLHWNLIGCFRTCLPARHSCWNPWKVFKTHHNYFILCFPASRHGSTVIDTRQVVRSSQGVYCIFRYLYWIKIFYLFSPLLRIILLFGKNKQTRSSCHNANQLNVLMIVIINVLKPSCWILWQKKKKIYRDTKCAEMLPRRYFCAHILIRSSLTSTRCC